MLTAFHINMRFFPDIAEDLCTAVLCSHITLSVPPSPMIQGKLRRSHWQVLSRTYLWWLSCSLGTVGGGQSQPFMCSHFASVGTSGEPKIAYSSRDYNLPYASYSLTQPAAATHGFGIFFFFLLFSFVCRS